MSLTITLLGTGSPIPDPERAGPTTLVQGDGTAILIDCGRGALMRLMAVGLWPPMLDALLVTHLHSDHISDLNDLITTQWIMTNEPTALKIVGPAGTAEVVDGIVASLRSDIRYRIEHHEDLSWEPVIEVTEVGPGATLTVGGASVAVGRTNHYPVEPTIGFRITQNEASVALAGDSIPCEGLDSLCEGADAYVQTVVRDDIVQLIPNERLQDILDYHSSVTQAAQTATRAGVGTLVLTHYVPAPAPGTEADWAAGAAEHFSGPVVAGPDLTTVTVP